MSVFVAIDFETADPKRDSACAVGLCRVENWKVVYRESVLIRPPRGMHPMNQRVHGLSWDDVKGAPSFAEVWAKLAPVLNGATRIVAHNASFDRSVLNACCCLAGVEPPKVEWVCTLEMARKRWGKPPGHSLPEACAHLGIEFTSHHEAGADAEACARVLIALEAPAPQTPEPPLSEVAQILEDIPPEYRSEAVLNLMRDAERLGPAHAADLVRALGRWFGRAPDGRYFCSACAAPCSWLCGHCARCVRETGDTT